jgi:glycosyltransferase involved in cell wall biosynthesis
VRHDQFGDARVGLFVARSEAWPDGYAPRPRQVVWSAGIDTWRRLASRGIWVHGSDESLGESGGRDVAAIARQASELGIRSRVALVPSVANPFSFMAAADVLALPSLWEGSSNVLLEAMGCGTPVVASTSAGDAQDLLDKGRFGLLVDPLDEAAMADAILRQVGDHAVMPGDRVRQFDRGPALAAYIQLFNQLAGRGSRPRSEEVPARDAAGLRPAMAATR